MERQPTRTRQARAEVTRQRIIDVAALAFATRGYEGVSFRDLVTESRLSKGAFYFHFDSKEELALATFRAKQEQLIARVLAVPAPEPLAERVRFLLRRRAQLIRADVSLGCVTRLGPELGQRAGPGSVYASFQDLGVGLIADVLREGRARGELRADLDPEAASRAVFASIVGMDALSLLFSEGKDLEERSEELLDLIVPGLLQPVQGPSGRRASHGKDQRHGRESSR